MPRDTQQSAATDESAAVAADEDGLLLGTPVAAIIDLLPDAVFLYNRHGRIVKTSALTRQIFALDAVPSYNSMPYEKRVALLAPRDLDGRPIPFDEWHITRILRGEVVSSAQPILARFTSLDGRDLVFSFTGAPIYDAQHRLIGAIAVGHDVTSRQRALDTGRENEGWLRILVEQAADAILVTNPSRRFVEVNASACDLLGYPHDELVGMRIEDIVQPADVERLGAAFPPAGSVHVGEWMLRRKDSTLVPVEISSRMLADGRCQAIIRDITERKRLERDVHAAAKEARVRAAQLEAVLDAIADGVYVYDAHGHLIRANTAAQSINPLTNQPDYLARPFSERIYSAFEIFDDLGRPVGPENVAVHRVLQGEELTGPNAVDTVVHYADGREVLLNTTGAPVRDASGAVTGGVITTRDVTAHRLLERRTRDALQALLEMARALVEDEPEAEPAKRGSRDYLRPTARRLVELARRMLGCDRASLLAHDAASGSTKPLAVSGLPAAMERLWWQTIPRVGPEDYLEPAEIEGLLAGHPVVASYARGRERGYPVYDLSGTLIVPMAVGSQLIGTLSVGYGPLPHTFTAEEIAFTQAVAHLCALVIDRDRLLRQRAESEARVLALEDTKRRMDEFLGIAGHELRTPLTTVKGNLQLAARRAQSLSDDAALEVDANGQAPARELRSLPTLLARAVAAADRQERLVNDLLDVSRIQAGQLEMRPETLDLVAVVRDRAEEQRLGNPQRVIRLHVPDGNVPVYADPDRVGQVITNYLTNALKYSASTKPVTLALTVEGDVARVSVRDHGPGLAPEERERVWERFYRVASVETLTGSGVGLGLGLHIARTTVERHGGIVGIESEPGKGSTFWFTLPLAR